MIRFLSGFIAVHIGLFVWGLAAMDQWVRGSGRGAETLILLLIIIPIVVAWATLEAIERFQPRRLFDVRVRRATPLVVAGLGAGVVAAVLTALGLLLVDTIVPHAIIIAIGSGVGVRLATLPLARKRPHECVHCGYDLTSTTSRCPECGAVGSRGKAARLGAGGASPAAPAE